MTADLDTSRTRQVGAADELKSRYLALALNGSRQYPLADITNVPHYVPGGPLRNVHIFNYRDPGTCVPAWKQNVYYAGTLLAQIDGPRNGVPVRSGLL